jgi:hypothetical protein
LKERPEADGYARGGSEITSYPVAP